MEEARGASGGPLVLTLDLQELLVALTLLLLARPVDDDDGAGADGGGV